MSLTKTDLIVIEQVIRESVVEALRRGWSIVSKQNYNQRTQHLCPLGAVVMCKAPGRLNDIMSELRNDHVGEDGYKEWLKSEFYDLLDEAVGGSFAEVINGVPTVTKAGIKVPWRFVYHFVDSFDGKITPPAEHWDAYAQNYQDRLDGFEMGKKFRREFIAGA